MLIINQAYGFKNLYWRALHLLTLDYKQTKQKGDSLILLADKFILEQISIMNNNLIIVHLLDCKGVLRKTVYLDKRVLKKSLE